MIKIVRQFTAIYGSILKIEKHPVIPAKEPVYLEGPKSRGYELLFAFRVFKQFIFRALHFVGPASLFLDPPVLKKTIHITSRPVNSKTDCGSRIYHAYRRWSAQEAANR